AFLIIVAVLLLVWRAKVRSTRHLVLNRATYPEGIHTPQRILLEQKSVASQDTTPEAVVVENELKKETCAKLTTLHPLQPRNLNRRQILHVLWGVSRFQRDSWINATLLVLSK